MRYCIYKTFVLFPDNHNIKKRISYDYANSAARHTFPLKRGCKAYSSCLKGKLLFILTLGVLRVFYLYNSNSSYKNDNTI